MNYENNYIIPIRVLTCLRGMTRQNNSNTVKRRSSRRPFVQYNICTRVLQYNMYTILYYIILYKCRAPFNGRAGSVYASLAESVGDRPGNFNETETIVVVVVVVLFIRIRTMILVVCAYTYIHIESVRGSVCMSERGCEGVRI
jgi:hypothetical protein